MDRRVITGVLVVMALGAGVWLFLREPPGAIKEGAPKPAPKSIDIVRPGPTKEPIKASPKDPESVATTPFHEAPSEPEGQKPVEKPLETGVRVKAVLKESGQPAAHAEILYFDPENLTPAQLMELRASLSDLEAVLRGHGRRFRADAQGEAWVPRGKQAVVGCSHNAHFGFTPLRRHLRENPQDVVKIELNPPAALRVRVKNQSGEAVSSVPVGLRFREARHSMDMLVATTGNDGVAVFKNLQLILDEVMSTGRGGSAAVGLAIPLAEPLEIPINPADLPRGDLELTLPACGSVTVNVMTMKGEPATKGIAHIAQRIDGEEARAGPMSGNMPSGVSMPVINGKAVFAHVGLGVELDVMVALDPESQPSQTKGPGPVAPGQDVSFQLRLETNLPVLLARVVDAMRAPVAESVLGVELHEESEDGTSSNSHRFKTDAEGRLTVPVRDGDPSVKVIRRRLEVRQRVGENDRTSVEIDVPAKLPPGETDLGELVLRDIPVLVSGVVVDAEEKPMANAKILVEQRYGDDARPRWSVVWKLNAHSDSNGRFEAREKIEGTAELRTRASMPGYLDSPPVPIRRGQSEVRLVLTRGGTVRGSLLLDPGLHRHVHVELGSSSEPLDLRGRGASRTTLPRNGEFEFRGVAAGSSKLTLSLRNDKTLLEIDGITVRAGEVTKDPRLDGIDLRGRVTLLKIGVRDAAGSPLEDFAVEVLDANERRSFEHASEPGLCEIVVLSTPLDLRIVKDGYRTVEVKGVRSDRQITLPAGLSVRIATTPAVPNLGPSFHVSLSLDPVPVEGSPRSLYLRSQRKTVNVNEVSFNVATPGEYHISAFVDQEAEHGGSSMGLPPLGKIIVADVPGEQVFQIQISPEKIQSTADSMKK